MRLPKRLKADAIVEALGEIRFESADSPEIVVGRLISNEPWRTYEVQRLAGADIPEAIRLTHADLKYQPALELRSSDGFHRIRIGRNIISYHNSGRYSGWAGFGPQLARTSQWLSSTLSRSTVKRLGLRYINAMNSAKHHISSIHELDVTVDIGGSRPDGPINLNFLRENDTTHRTMTRIASPSFVQGSIPPDTAVVVDIDVFTPDQFEATNPDVVSTWLEEAHRFEKEAFFKLIPARILDQLVEEW